MEVVSVSPLSVASLLWQPRPDVWMLTCFAKATFDLAPGEAHLSAEQEPINEEDNYLDDDETRSLYSASDLVPMKPRCDVVLVGSAYSPDELPVRSLFIRLLIGEVDKIVEAVSDRVFVQDGTIREGSPFTRMPLVYERAAGGHDSWNPVGVRSDMRDVYGRTKIPNFQPPGMIISSPSDIVPAMGFGPIAPGWPSRRDKLGRHAATWSPRSLLDRPLPDDLDRSFFNAAPRDQQLAELRDDERIILENLHPEVPRLVTNLPGIKPRAVLEARGAKQPVALRADTLWIDTDRRLVTITWSGQVPLNRPEEAGRVVFSLDDKAQGPSSTTFVGESTGPIELPKPPSQKRGTMPPPPPPASGGPSSSPTITNPDVELEKLQASRAIRKTHTLPFVRSFNLPEDERRALGTTTSGLPFVQAGAPPPPPPPPPPPVTPTFGAPPPPASPVFGAPPPSGGFRLNEPLSAKPRTPTPPAPPPDPTSSSPMPSWAKAPAGPSAPMAPVAPIPAPRPSAPSWGGLPPEQPSFRAPEHLGQSGAFKPPPEHLGQSGAFKPPPEHLGQSGAFKPPPEHLGQSGAFKPPPIVPSPAIVPPPPLPSSSGKPADSMWSIAGLNRPDQPPSKSIGESAVEAAGNVYVQQADASSGVLAASNTAAGPVTPIPAGMAKDGKDAKDAQGATGAASTVRSSGAMDARDVLHLIWYSPEHVPRICRVPVFRAILDRREEEESDGLDEELDNKSPNTDPVEIEDTRDVFEILVNAASLDADQLNDELTAAAKPNKKFVPSLLLMMGELSLPFDEREVLKATIGVVTPLIGTDEPLKAAVKDAKDFLSSSDIICPPSIIEGMTTRIKEAFQKARKTVSPDYVDTQTERVLLERRAYQTRQVLGMTAIRALLHSSASSAVKPAPVYLPDSIAKKLPLFSRFRARFIAELYLQEDQFEQHPGALKVLALGRVASPAVAEGPAAQSGGKPVEKKS